MRSRLLLAAAIACSACGVSTLEVSDPSHSTALVTSGGTDPTAAVTGASTSSETLGDGGSGGGSELPADAGTPAQCTPNQTATCETSCGSVGIRACTSEMLWGTACTPPHEICGNGIDDDCNGQVDGYDPACQVCTPNTTRACTTSCGGTSTQVCTADGQWSTACTPPAEICGNGKDDDCNGKADGADPVCWVCTPGTTKGCTTSCGSTGTRTCDGVGQWGAACAKPAEQCNNGIDDDCDGKVDGHDTDCPPTVYTCEAAEGHGCNGDMGYGDHCNTWDNTNGCSASRFWAWCNRRNSAYPNIWDAWVHDWVSNRCDGLTTDNGQNYDTWSCTSSNNDRFECTTPLVLSFDPKRRVQFVSGRASFAFTPGEPVDSDFPSAATPWLVRDLDGNGAIDDGRELFGSDTVLPGERKAVNGFEALAALDANHDGRLDAEDPAFHGLRLWRDVNGDKRSTTDELETLPHAGVTSLTVVYSLAVRCDAKGNCERERAGFTWTDKRGQERIGAVIDVYLATRPAAALLSTR